jgi:hypothetical protein
MQPSLVRRGLRAAPGAQVLLVALVGALLAACGAAGASSSSPAASPPSVSEPPRSVAPASPPAAVDIETLIASGVAHDGAIITVKGFFLTDGTDHAFCAVVLESYPPQCGGTAIVIDGAVPPPALALLETPDDPNLAKVAWGRVELRGTYHAAAAGGKPSLDLTEMRVTGPG